MSQQMSPPPVSWLYDIILNVFSLAVQLFFRDVQVRGTWRIPSKGPVILVAAPHSNQFVDSVVLMRILRAANRQISWLMAEVSFKRAFVGAMARGIGAVPVSRAQDIAVKAEGSIFLADPINSSPKLVRGVGTDFTGEGFKVGGSIYLPSMNGESQKLDIAQILGPEDMILRSEVRNRDALLLLTVKRKTVNGIVVEEGTEFKVAPHVDQTMVYDSVFEKLRAGGCIGIFPEGGSHDRTQLLPLKAGIAIMALGALAKDIPITIVPVGLTYFSAHKFRSRAVIEFGDAVTVEPDVLQDFKDGKNKRKAIGDVMVETEKALKAVTVSAPDFDTLQLIHAARRLYLTRTPYNDSTVKISLANITESNRRLSNGYTTYAKTLEMISFTKDLKSYTTSLAALGLKDHQLLMTQSKHNHFPRFFLLTKLLYRLIKLSILAFLTLPGLVLFAPVFILTRRMSHKKTAEALAASSVKIKAHDVMATWKILIAVALAPCFYLFYSILLVFLSSHNLTFGLIPRFTSTLTIVLLSWLILPAISYASLLFGEQGMDLLKSLPPLLLSLNPRSSRVIERLREQRKGLVSKVREIVDRFGAEVFPDCQEIQMWKGRGPRKMYADVSPEMEVGDFLELDEFV